MEKQALRRKTLQIIFCCFFLYLQQFNLLSLRMKCCFSYLRVLYVLNNLAFRQQQLEQGREMWNVVRFYWNHPITITNDTLQQKGFSLEQKEKSRIENSVGVRIERFEGLLYVINIEKFSSFLIFWWQLEKGICELIYCFLGSSRTLYGIV